MQNEKGEEEEKEMYQLLVIRANSSAKCSLRIVELGELFHGRSVSNLLLSTSQILHLVIIPALEIISLSLLDHSFVFHELMGFGASAPLVRIGSLAVESLIPVGTEHS